MNTKVRLRRVLAIAVFSLAAAAGGYSQDIQFAGKVTEVLDGDSIVVTQVGGEKHLVRLAGIDAPEQNQGFGKKSKKFLSDLLLDKAVTVSGSRIDRNGELVGKVLLYGRDISLEMVIAGYAWHYKLYPGEQTDRDRQLFESAEFHARKSRFNLWSDARPIPPWEHRKEPSELADLELKKLSNPSRPTLPIQENMAPQASASPAQGVTERATTINGEVRGNKNSKIYHWPGCPGYTKIADHNRVTFRSRSEAETAGYRAAKNCN